MSTVGTVSEGRSFGGGGSSVGGATTLFVLVMGIAIVQFGGNAQRVLLSTSLAMSFYALITFAPRIGIPGVLIFLNFIGIIRRYSVPFLGYSSMDALLLITPIASGLYLLNQLLNRSLQWDTKLSKIVGGLIIVMLVEVLNPLQGGIVLGLMGIMTFTVPYVWYYIGRNCSSRSILYAILNVLIVLSCISGIYGMWQTFFGFTDVEREWFALTNTDYGQVITGGFMRVFATYSSFAEYVRIMLLGACACLGMMRRNRLYVIPFLFLGTAVALSSSRGSLLTLFASVAYVWAVQGKTPRSWIPRLVLAAVIAGASLIFGLGAAQQAAPDSGPVGTVIDYQAKGILKATDTRESTAGGHVTGIFGTFINSFRNPLGSGVGAATIHAGSYTSNVVIAENDVPNMYGSLGFIGGTLYLMSIAYSIFIAGSLWNRYRDPATLGVLTMMLSSLGAWGIAGQYLLPVVLWVTIGILDGMYRQSEVAKPKALRRGGMLRPQVSAMSSPAPVDVQA